jgi:hypothetical protein
VSRSIGRELPRELFADLDGSHLDAKAGLTILLMTTDEAGWPCVALLSVGEVVAPTTMTIKLALWPGPTETRILSRTGRGTLAIFGDPRMRCIARRPRASAAAGCPGRPRLGDRGSYR